MTYQATCENAERSSFYDQHDHSGKNPAGVYSRGCREWCPPTADSDGGQGFPASASRIALSAGGRGGGRVEVALGAAPVGEGGEVMPGRRPPGGAWGAARSRTMSRCSCVRHGCPVGRPRCGDRKLDNWKRGGRAVHPAYVTMADLDQHAGVWPCVRRAALREAEFGADDGPAAPEASP
jgi:hypothetical protein